MPIKKLYPLSNPRQITHSTVDPNESVFFMLKELIHRDLVKKIFFTTFNKINKYFYILTSKSVFENFIPTWNFFLIEKHDALGLEAV